MRSISLNADSIQELNFKLDKLSATQFRPTLAIVFSSISQNLDEVQAVFAKRNIDLVGSSTAGEICDADVYSSSIVVLLMDMNREWYRLNYRETGTQTTYQIAYDSGVFAKECFANPGVVVVSGGMAVDAEQIVFGIKDGIGREVPLFGGLAGDDLGMDRTFAFTQSDKTDDGIISLVIDTDKVEVRGMAACGWEAIGAVNTITSAEGNIVRTINGEPALDVFLRYFGFFDNANNTAEEGMMSTISGQYPLQIMREGGYSILRSPLIGNEEDRSLILAGGVQEGDKFRFSISPGFEVIDHTIKEFEDLKNRAPKADALILFSCKGRHAALGPLIEQEIQGIFDHWNTPMIGFFTYGEIGQTKEGICEFHNETCSLVIFREK